jgi:NADPH:quinone reductase-like Zn-dependent oxidoreductase
VKYARVVVTQPGGPDVLQIVEEEALEPKAGEVRVKVLAAGVSYADLLMREGVHPETPATPFTPGWDLIGRVDRLGDGVSGFEPGQMVAALPVYGGYTEVICLPQDELIPVPADLDAAEAVSLVMNYVTAYQMMHRSAQIRGGQRVLIHGAAGGIGSALLQLGRLAGLELYATCSSRGTAFVSERGGMPIDYQQLDFVNELHRLTGNGVDVVFDGIGGTHVWRFRQALRPGGKVVAYGLTSSLRRGRLGEGRRYRFRGVALLGVYIMLGWLLPGRKRVLIYRIQRLKRRRPAWYRQDLGTLFELLEQRKITPIIAQRFPLREAKRAHELLGKGAVAGKAVLMCETVHGAGAA